MLLRSHAPTAWKAWNQRFAAPFGRGTWLPFRVRVLPFIAQWCGPFAFQPNNDTRRVEYPWAWEVANPLPGMKVVEIGGAYSGFQFILARHGCDVVNVDPGLQARGRGWPVTERGIHLLNRRFGTRVILKNCVLEQAGIEPETCDRVFSISTIEHIPEDEIASLVRTVAAILKPGGLFVATVDLFLDLIPFTNIPENKYGKNISIKDLIEKSGLALVRGDPSELHGFEEFDPDRVLRRVNEGALLVGRGYPVAVQAFVLGRIA